MAADARLLRDLGRTAAITLPRALGVASNPPGATFGPRSMADWEFVLMLEGGARYRWCDRWWNVPQATVVLCRPTPEGATDAFDWDPLLQSRHAYVHFDLPGLSAHSTAALPWVRALDDADVWRPLFRHARTLVAQPSSPVRDAALLATTRHLLLTFAVDLLDAGPLPEPAWPEPVRAATAFALARLEADPSATITLAALADAACVTPAYLCRAFRRATGRSPLGFVRAHRLDRALAMLTRSNEPVGRVARACGFASGFHFSRRFKEQFGRSPTAVRDGARRGVTPPLPRLHRHWREVNGGHDLANNTPRPNRVAAAQSDA